MLILGPITGQGCSGERVGSGEKHLLEHQVADLLSATSRGANALPQGAQVRAGCACQHTVSVTHSGATRVTFSRSKEQRAFVSPLSVTRIRLSSIKTSVTPTTTPIDHF